MSVLYLVLSIVVALLLGAQLFIISRRWRDTPDRRWFILADRYRHTELNVAGLSSLAHFGGRGFIVLPVVVASQGDHLYLRVAEPAPARYPPLLVPASDIVSETAPYEKWATQLTFTQVPGITLFLDRSASPSLSPLPLSRRENEGSVA